MKNNSTIPDHQLINYVKGEVTAEEKQEVEAWLSVDENNQVALDKIKSTWLSAQSIADFEAIDLTKNWAEIQAKINKQEIKKPLTRYIWRYAAGLVLIAMATFLILKPGQVEMLEMTASNGLLEVTLADETSVWLNEGATLVYPASFTDSKREVSLTGEAFFDVAHNPEQPFVVSAGDTKTEVLGTSFNLNKAEGEVLELALITGKVRFLKGNQHATLEPGQKISVDKEGLVLKSVNRKSNFMSWRTNTLTFENTPMKEAIGDISQHYNIVLEIMDEGFLGCQITTTFEDEPLEHVLETIADLFNITVQRDGQIYQLMGKGCNIN